MYCMDFDTRRKIKQYDCKYSYMGQRTLKYNEILQKCSLGKLIILQIFIKEGSCFIIFNYL